MIGPVWENVLLIHTDTAQRNWFRSYVIWVCSKRADLMVLELRRCKSEFIETTKEGEWGQNREEQGKQRSNKILMSLFESPGPAIPVAGQCLWTFSWVCQSVQLCTLYVCFTRIHFSLFWSLLPHTIFYHSKSKPFAYIFAKKKEWMAYEASGNLNKQERKKKNRNILLRR